MTRRTGGLSLETAEPEEVAQHLQSAERKELLTQNSICAQRQHPSEVKYRGFLQRTETRECAASRLLLTELLQEVLQTKRRDTGTSETSNVKE